MTNSFCLGLLAPALKVCPALSLLKKHRVVTRRKWREKKKGKILSVPSYSMSNCYKEKPDKERNTGKTLSVPSYSMSNCYKEKPDKERNTGKDFISSQLFHVQLFRLT